MNFLAAWLLLALPTDMPGDAEHGGREERAFWLLSTLIHRILPPDYYSSTMFDTQVRMRLLVYACVGKCTCHCCRALCF